MLTKEQFDQLKQGIENQDIPNGFQVVKDLVEYAADLQQKLELERNTLFAESQRKQQLMEQQAKPVDIANPSPEQLYMMVTGRFKAGTFPWSMVSESGKSAWAAAAAELVFAPDTIMASHATQQAEPVALHPDDAAVDRFAQAMKDKLALARAKGRSGWDDPNKCSVEFLAELLCGHLGKGNAGTFEDIANFAMMLHQRDADPTILAAALNEMRYAAHPPAVAVLGVTNISMETIGGNHRVVLHVGTIGEMYDLGKSLRTILSAAPQPAVLTLNQAQVEALKEVLRISDRSHEAWDILKKALK